MQFFTISFFVSFHKLVSTEPKLVG